MSSQDSSRNSEILLLDLHALCGPLYTAPFDARNSHIQFDTSALEWSFLELSGGSFPFYCKFIAKCASFVFGLLFAIIWYK